MELDDDDGGFIHYENRVIKMQQIYLCDARNADLYVETTKKPKEFFTC